jgi:ABC-type uncharacterized transport system involved in gliding motility auxiliary subunit
MKSSRITRIFGGAVGVLLLLGILIAANAVVSSLRLRADLTEGKVYTLSDGTGQVLKELPKEVTLKFFVSRADETAPLFLKQYAQRIADLLREYALAGGGKVAVETYDPLPDSDEEEWAQRFGLTPRSFGTIGAAPDFYLGLVAVAGTQEAAIPFFTPDAEPQLEYLVTQLIHRVVQTGPAKIGVISSLPVAGPPVSYPGQPSRGWLIVEELRKSYEVTALPNPEEIPDGLSALLVVHPKDLSERALYAIDQFVLKGGRLLALVDPLSLAEQEIEKRPAPYGLLGAASDLNRLSQGWGVELTTGSVVADLQNASVVTSGGGASERMPTWLSLRPSSINRTEMATSSLENLMFPFPGGFTIQTAAERTIAFLLNTSADTSLINSFEAIQPGAEKMKNARPQGSLPLAVRIQGTFPSAFPEGPPPAEGEEKNPPPAPGLKKSSRPGTVIMIGDVDFIYDRFCARGMGFFGQTIYTPINDNLNLVLNLVEELTGSGALIGLRSRGTYGRPFDRVIALEKEAQGRWQAEEIKLTNKLADTQARIKELQEARGDDQNLVLTPEQKKEIDTFRAERFETQRQLKLVRRNLRQDIERLGFELKTLNFVPIPLLAIAFGVFHWYRRKKAGTA